MLAATRARLVFVGLVFGAGFWVGKGLSLPVAAEVQADRVFELRTYTTHEGRLDNLEARFRDHTMRIFEKHGMTNIGYWIPQDAPASENTLIYLLAHDDREQAAESWRRFRDDPEWQRVSRESQVDGAIVSNVESVFMDPTDFSSMR